MEFGETEDKGAVTPLTSRDNSTKNPSGQEFLRNSRPKMEPMDGLPLGSRIVGIKNCWDKKLLEFNFAGKKYYWDTILLG